MANTWEYSISNGEISFRFERIPWRVNIYSYFPGGRVVGDTYTSSLGNISQDAASEGFVF